ncbi:formin-homology 2 domain-containing protein [Plasmopara halstedii]|uniref:Formin-homology 2 domain-containing protein n=1 Tax=Plasmopara halstedii TaxID=4781 RepID=A0A0N7L5W7_PLAHL|nr:formin-homology 2 domain-containing protein [Plasmopara halstedii]CEG42627.1 formin-homology 2 domain-containing protein [Plasmopara halstedii]|eukprot:XP_024578996.1 formin-homology 2 domain-containing protein [Plasmopara halstedii]
MERHSVISPTNANSFSHAATPPSSHSRVSISSRLSILPDDAFKREPHCGVCTKSFNILRRRHHCRSCHIAVCKECGGKAIDRTKPERTRPQWYCMSCLDDNASLDITGSRPPSGKRRSFSTSFSAPTNAPQVTNLTSTAKFCIECGYELPPRVKFCIECGTSVRPQVMSPVSVDSVGTAEVDRGNRGFRDSLGSNLTVIEENSGSPTEPTDGSDDGIPVDHGLEDAGYQEKNVSDESLENDDTCKAKEYEELVAQLQVENEKLRSRVEKFKRKISEAERQRVEREEEHARALSEAAAAAAMASPERLTDIRRMSEPPPLTSTSVSVKSDPTSNGIGVAAKDHPDYMKYFKLLSMGLPADQVKLKMQASGVDSSVLDDPNAVIGGNPTSSALTSQVEKNGVLVKDDEQYAKFFKLSKMGMPSEQIKLKMSASGLNPDLLDTPDALLSGSNGSSLSAADPNQTMSVMDDPVYQKFFKLLKMGMPHAQVKLKMSAAGLNADLLDMPDAPSPNQKAGGSNGGLLAGLPPPAAAVKVDTSALQASLASKATQKSVPNNKEESQLPKKEIVKPNVELRPLFWTRVPVNVVSRTVWMKLNDSHAELDVDEMEWMFRKNPVDTSKKQDEKKKDADKVVAQPKEVLLFDPKRQQNISIAIARFKLSSEDIKKSIYALDGQKLGNEVLNVLISISPTLEEIDMLKNYDGDVKMLGNVERFFLDLLTIPRYTQRIKCFRFKLQFENRILETQAQLDTLVAATEQVAESDKFRRVLEHILAIGNYLNGSTPRGGAYGFKLDTLMKLHTLKSIDPRVTLMHFLLRQLEEKNPDVITFAGEVPHIVEAKRLSLDQLRADLSSYNTELAMLKGQVRASQNDHIVGDRFFEVMTPFAKDAEEVLEELGRDFNGLETLYQELVTSFGEDPRKVGPIEFFSILDEFVKEFKKAYRQNQTKEYQAIYEEAAEARVAAMAEKAERLKREAEELQRLEEERQQNSHETKAIYAEIMSIITIWAGKHSPGNEETLIEQFKDTSRKFGTNEITGDEFCDKVRQLIGSKCASKIISNSVNLIQDKTKQNELLEAFVRFKEQVKREKELKKQQRNSLVSPSSGRERAGSSSAGRRRKVVIPPAMKDIEPVVGEEAQLLHKSILESVLAAFGGDTKKMKSFTSHTRKYGNEQITAHEFYQYLMDSFDPDFVGRLVPDLARLLQDAEKRHALIRALCESAPGWAKFAGL